MAQIVVKNRWFVNSLTKPLFTSSCIFGCTMFMGDIIGQSLSSNTTTIDLKRSLSVGISGFMFSGPMSMGLARIVRTLYPGSGRYTVMKRIIISSCISPVTIACGIIPSAYIQTRDSESVRERLVNRLPMSWTMSLLFLSPFSYIQSRIIIRRFQNVAKNSCNVFYNSLMSFKKSSNGSDDFLVEIFF